MRYAIDEPSGPRARVGPNWAPGAYPGPLYLPGDWVTFTPPAGGGRERGGGQASPPAAGVVATAARFPSREAARNGRNGSVAAPIPVPGSSSRILGRASGSTARYPNEDAPRRKWKTE